jgi:hypothetical protein
MPLASIQSGSVPTDTNEYRRYQRLLARYPLDRCREVAAYVLDCSDVSDEDRLCASGILNALEAADHARDLTIIGVSQGQLHAAARADARRLWRVYGERESSDSRSTDCDNL